MNRRFILFGILTLLVLGIIAGANLFKNATSPIPEQAKEETLLLELEILIDQGYTNSPGALPISLQLEELREKMESGDYRFAQGQALGETSIAAKNQAFSEAREQLLKTNSSSNIETILQCSLEKEQGVAIFLILGVKK